MLLDVRSRQRRILLLVYTLESMAALQVSLIGERSDFVCSGSDGGSIFIWSSASGRLVNVLRANDTVTTCVAPHPHTPMLASCGFEPAVRLWSPEVSKAGMLLQALGHACLGTESIKCSTMKYSAVMSGPCWLLCWLGRLTHALLLASTGRNDNSHMP